MPAHSLFNLKAGIGPLSEGTMLVLEEPLDLIELRRRPLDDDGNEFEDGEFEFDDDDDEDDPFDDDEEDDDDDDDEDDDIDDLDEDDPLGGGDDE